MSEPAPAPGTFCWNELMARDASAAEGFYSELFGWTVDHQEFGPVKYTTFMQGETPVGGMLQIFEEMGEMPPHWVSYVLVEDCDAAIAKAEGLGGKLLYGPRDIPGVCRIAWIQDPQGATVAVADFPPPSD